MEVSVGYEIPTIVNRYVYNFTIPSSLVVKSGDKLVVSCTRLDLNQTYTLDYVVQAALNPTTPSNPNPVPLPAPVDSSLNSAPSVKPVSDTQSKGSTPTVSKSNVVLPPNTGANFNLASPFLAISAGFLAALVIWRYSKK